MESFVETTQETSSVAETSNLATFDGLPESSFRQTWFVYIIRRTELFCRVVGEGDTPLEADSELDVLQNSLHCHLKAKEITMTDKSKLIL